VEKALFVAWERQIAEMAGLETAFSCVPTLFSLIGFNPRRTGPDVQRIRLINIQ